METTDAGQDPPHLVAVADAEPDDADEPTAQIHAVELGAGRPVVFLHELCSSLASFADVVDKVSEDWRCVMIDLPGHGGSSPLLEPVDAAGLVAQIAQALEDFSAAPATIVGHGAGGAVALAIAASRPDLVSALALVATDLDRPAVLPGLDLDAVPATVGATAEIDSIAVGRRRPRSQREILVEELFPASFAEPFFRELPGRASLERELLAALDPEPVAEVARAIADLPPLSVLAAQVRRPALVLGGALDVITPPAAIARTAAALRTNASMVPGAGHMVPVEAPDAMAERLRRFLA